MISVQDCVATVTGTVYSDSQRDMAISAIKQTPEVRKVDDEIKVDKTRGDRDDYVVGRTAAPISSDVSDRKDYVSDRKEEQNEHHSDKWIAVKVKSALAFHKDVSATHTDVNVLNGVVTLSGTAKNEAQKELTEQYAKSTEGVRDVRNEIQVRDDGAPMAVRDTDRRSTFAGDNGYSTGSKIDDSSITAKVKLQLAKHHSTSAMKTEVHTRDGIVEISGIAANSAEKELVTKLASGVAGVASVRNDMTVENQ
jgi:osmotically-inducible protein OsmY